MSATQKADSSAEAARVQPEVPKAASHAITRLRHRLEPNPEQVWAEAKGLVQFNQGVLVIDDATLDKFDAEKMELVTRRSQQSFLEVASRKAGERSGKHAGVVQGLNLITVLWTKGDRHIPRNYRLYEKLVDGATKNEHLRSILKTAKERELHPEGVGFERWYSSLDNIKLIRSYNWIWLMRV